MKKEKLIEITLLAKILREESQPLDGHFDPESYNDCWRFLIEDLESLNQENDSKRLVLELEDLAGRIEIKQPVAFPGDKVVFNNPRLKEGQSIGKVIHLETHWRDKGEGEYQHRYLIRPNGKSYTVCVKDVELLNQQHEKRKEKR